MNRTFASDNYSGVHPRIMEAIIEANKGHAPSYGADEYTHRAIAAFRELFGHDREVFLVYNGTGANVLALKTLSQSFNAVICSELAHINVDESTATENFTGCKVIPVPHRNGKIHADEIRRKLIRIGDQHHPQARVISISQTTEYATVYTVDEIRELAALAREYKIYLHMDGSRISNAAVSLKKEFAEFTFDAGVDVLSFGGTKNGMMFGEAVIFANPETANYFKFFRKQGMQLHSKMRFIGAQFTALLKERLWETTARHSNEMASRLGKGLEQISGIELTQPVEANGVFAIFPPEIIAPLQQESFFYVWNDRTSEVRLMCSFDTTEEDVDKFVRNVAGLMRRKSLIA